MPQGAPNIHVTAERALIVESSHDAIIGMTLSGLVSSCNPAAVELYGYEVEDLVGRSIEILVPPESRAQEAEILRRIAAGEQVAPYRADRIGQDGTVIAVSLTISPIVDASGAVAGAATVSHRAVDQHEARDHFEARVDQQRLEVREAQDRFQAGMEAERARERIQVQEAQERFQVGMEAERAKERIQVQQAQDRFQARMDTERTKERAQVQEAQNRFQSRMDTERTKERAQVQGAEDRFQVGIDAERAQAESDRNLLQRQLEQSQRLDVLGQLAGGIAHDFNNLLAVILNYAEFVTRELADGPDSDWEAARRDVGQIQRAAERAAALTHQLLAFARREVVRPRVVDLNDVVTDVERLLRRSIGEDVLLRTDLSAQLWPVLVDAGQIEQVLVNLAVNARDAMTAGGRLTIRTSNVGTGSSAPPDRRVRLQVSDTGTGMTPEVIEHAFEPFYTTKAAGSGTGLGLATVYGIVTQAGGTIEIRSRPGSGSVFSIVLPATDELPEPVEDVAAYERTGQGETVLVVEDEQSLRDVTERILTRGGYRVLTAASGSDAIRIATRHNGEIHLLVTDVVMPQMLGKEVAEQIRRIRPGLQVLYMSGYARQVLALQGRLEPGVELIEKPFSASMLVQRVGELLHDPAADS